MEVEHLRLKVTKAKSWHTTSNAGASPGNPAIPVTDLAAYTAIANIILNMDETITKS